LRYDIFVIANGRLGNDQTIGDFTFYSKNGYSVVDYLLLNPENVEYTNDFEIELLNELSDRCSITFCFINTLANTENTATQNDSHKSQYVKFKFDDNKVTHCYNTYIHIQQNNTTYKSP